MSEAAATEFVHPNQYSRLVLTKPEMILNDLSSERVLLLHERMKAFPCCIIELGSGSGMHLLKLAAQDPSRLCIGVELRYKRAFRTAEKAEQAGLQNVLLVRGEAEETLDVLLDGSITCCYVNYPDPWDKPRWYKNRLLQASLFDRLERVLVSHGGLHYKTDHQDYFQSTMELVATRTRWSVTHRTEDLFGSEWVEGNIPTEFEGLFRSQRKTLCMARMVVGAAAPRTLPWT